MTDDASAYTQPYEYPYQRLYYCSVVSSVVQKRTAPLTGRVNPV
jgi:hypothetical protein